MNDVIIGIREGELGALGLEVLDYSSRMSDIFDRIDACMDRLPGCYQGPPCDKLMERYKALRAFYPVVKNNLKSYSDDLITLINKMQVNDKYLGTLFQEYTSDTNSQIRNNNNFILK